MDFQQAFETLKAELKPVTEQVGVMSIDSLERQWDFVTVYHYAAPEHPILLVAHSKDKQKVLIGRMGIRDDGKFCIEIHLKATIENDQLCGIEKWYVDPKQYEERFAELLEAMQDHLN